ncbi:flagellar hook-basal body complex protein FliE [Mesobacillus maritimus]|uniref:flagellar hook-basal body complex protein FliE n=1 Tax=Mesobacillus maritimus TaxID=1643336 RepID=UPI00384FE3F7
MNHVSSIQTPFIQSQAIPKAAADRKVDGFGDLFKKALQEVDTAQKESQMKTQQLVMGEGTDIHEVMIAGQKSNLSLQLTVQTRNKVVEAYQEIMRMQV